MKSVGLTIDTLCGNTMRTTLAGIVKLHVETIDSLIQNAYANGINKIVYELPTTFDLGNLDKKQGQILVYSEIICLFRTPVSDGGKGFDNTYIKLNPDSTILIVEWNDIFPQKERDSRNDIIKMATQLPEHLAPRNLKVTHRTNR